MGWGGKKGMEGKGRGRWSQDGKAVEVARPAVRSVRAVSVCVLESATLAHLRESVCPSQIAISDLTCIILSSTTPRQKTTLHALLGYATTLGRTLFVPFYSCRTAEGL